VPSGDGCREYVERDDYPDADLSDAVFHFLSGEAPADAIEDAACLAAGISDRGQRRGLSVARMVRSVVGAGGHDLCPGSGCDGSCGDRRYVGGQRNHDGHVQSDLQYGRRFGGSDAAFVRRGRPCYVSGDSLPRGTGAGAAVRLRPVVPKIPAGSGVLGIEAQPDFVLYVVGVTGCRHRPHDHFYHRPGERRTLDRNRTGTRCDGDLRGSVRSGTDAGTPLR